MKKTIPLLITALCLMFLQPELLWAGTRSFTMNASIPSSTGVSINVRKVGDWDFLPSDLHLLDFGPMTFDTTNNIWMPACSFSIMVSPSGGDVDATVNYTEGQNPNGPNGKGLGWHAFARFRSWNQSTYGYTSVDLSTHGPRKLLKDVMNEHFTAGNEMTGWSSLGIDLKLATGDPSDPASAVPFTNSDAGGTYDGTLTITATVL